MIEENIEILGFDIEISKKFWYLVYIPPFKRKQMKFYSSIENECKKKDSIIVGDFNDPDIDWKNPDMLSSDLALFAVLKIISHR